MNAAELAAELQHNLTDCAFGLSSFRVVEHSELSDDVRSAVPRDACAAFAVLEVEPSLSLVVCLDARGYTILNALPDGAPPERTFETLSTLLQHHSAAYQERMVQYLFAAFRQEEEAE